MAKLRGRQPVSTNRVAYELFFLVREGVSLRRAAAAVDIPYQTVIR